MTHSERKGGETGRRERRETESEQSVGVETCDADSDTGSSIDRLLRSSKSSKIDRVLEHFSAGRTRSAGVGVCEIDVGVLYTTRESAGQRD